MSSISTLVAAVVGATVLAATALIASPAGAAALASAAVTKTPTTVRANAAAAEATVTYKCRNDATSVYHIRALLTQNATGAYYGRGDDDSPVFERLPATCTGKKVTETIALYTYGNGPISTGKAAFEFTLYSLAPPPGSYYGQPGTGPEARASRTVKVQLAR